MKCGSPESQCRAISRMPHVRQPSYSCLLSIPADAWCRVCLHCVSLVSVWLRFLFSSAVFCSIHTRCCTSPGIQCYNTADPKSEKLQSSLAAVRWQWQSSSLLYITASQCIEIIYPETHGIVLCCWSDSARKDCIMAVGTFVTLLRWFIILSWREFLPFTR